MKKIRILGSCHHHRLGSLSRKSGPMNDGVITVDDDSARDLIAAGAAASLMPPEAVKAPKPNPAGMAQPLSASPVGQALLNPTVMPLDGGEYQAKVEVPPKRRRGRKKKDESSV